MLTNELFAFLDKEPGEVQREDIIRFIEAKGVNFLNLRYPALDGRLKTLRIPLTSRGRAEEVLAEGERVDGSSLFGSIVDPARSDLYVVPIYATAFVNPFVENTLDICCRFMDSEGNPEPWTPQGVLERASQAFTDDTKMELRALCELEFFLIMEQEDNRFPATPQGGYHESGPFLRGGRVLNEIVDVLSRITPAIKYSHGEVGVIPTMESRYPEVDGKRAEQFEVEFLPQPLLKAGLDALVAKWVVRRVAHKYGMTATFVPKMVVGYAGNGMHFHLEAVKDGKNAMLTDGKLSEAARRMVGGLVQFAQTITAFGNTCASSYMRLVPGQEAPTKICWSDNNRSAMIREPLGWANAASMDQKVNPGQEVSYVGKKVRQTVELRTPDGSADVLLTLAAIGVAARWGMMNPKALKKCEETYVAGDVCKDKSLGQHLDSLPPSCADSAEMLKRYRADYERDEVFHPVLIDHVISRLQSEDDGRLQEKLNGMALDARRRFAESIMHKDLHRQ